MARLPVGKSSIKLSDLETSLVTLCQFVDKLKERHKDAALTEMDLSDEGFEDEMCVIRAACGYDPEDVMDEDEDEEPVTV